MKISYVVNAKVRERDCNLEKRHRNIGGDGIYHEWSMH